ncbi:MAG TPA: ABC transporter ATP-binding protein [Tepidisphaeraceae bacterium]|nr:ABC transporter ATP-binding protein [Tepidisphaeraceae bacterium]
MPSSPAIVVRSLRHCYGGHVAIENLDLSINPGEIFGILGPNGSGKSTLFRILSTLIPPQQGDVAYFGTPLSVANLTNIRSQLGVVFQAPALDKTLTGFENLLHQGHLYGLRGTDLRTRIDQNLTAVGMIEHARRRSDRLSGGQRRRIELAKALLHNPTLLILDEPSTGLDPAARIEFWNVLQSLRDQGTTILLTTHLMEEAEACTRVAIFDAGKCVAVDAPAALRQRIGGQIITLTADNLPQLATAVDSTCRASLTAAPVIIDDELRIESSDPEQLLRQLIALAGPGLKRISLSQPTMQDVFLHLTGNKFDR